MGLHVEHFLVISTRLLWDGMLFDLKGRKLLGLSCCVVLLNCAYACFPFLDGYLDRLPTKDGLRAWEIAIDGVCVPYQHDMKTENRLFFGCPYS